MIASSRDGRQTGFQEGFKFTEEGRLPEEFVLYGQDTAKALANQTKTFDNLKLSIEDQIAELADKEDGIDQLKTLLADDEESQEEAEVEGAGKEDATS